MRLREQHLALKALIDSSGWGVLGTYVQIQQDQAVSALVNSPLGSLDEALKQEYEKGRIAGISQVMALPEVLREQLWHDITEAEENGGHDGSGSSDTPDTDRE